MKNVEILSQVNYGGKFYNPSPKGSVVLSVPDHTAEHWIATGVAKATSEAPTKTAETKAAEARLADAKAAEVRAAADVKANETKK